MTRHPDWPKRWRVWKDRGDWIVSSPEYETRGFRAHAEALDYADRQARTREYVLPRISHSGDWVPNMPTLRLGWEKHPTEKTFWVEDQGHGSITVRPDELLPLALALAALAEQEESCGR